LPKFRVPYSRLFESADALMLIFTDFKERLTNWMGSGFNCVH